MSEALAALDIVRNDLEGDGTGEIDGRPVSVPFTIPGERVEVRLRRDHGGVSRGDVVRVMRASPHRVAAPCRHFGSCGGCAWQHIAYAEQLRLKQRLLQSLLDAALGGRAPTVAATLATPEGGRGTAGVDASRAPWGYRNKVHFVFGPGHRGQSLVMGHYGRGSGTVVAVEECPVHAEAGNRVAFALRDALERARVPGSSPDGDDGVARHVVVRVTEATDELLVTLVVTENVKALRRVTGDVQAWLTAAPSGTRARRSGFHLNVHDRPGPFLFGRETRRLFGESEVRERVAGASYQIAPTAFFQTNVRAAEVLARLVLDALPRDRCPRVLDLYSGVGLFALPLAMRGQAVTAVEENRDAVAAAATALRVNRVPARACRLMASKLEDALPRLTDSTWDAVVLDPPRQGCPPRVLDQIVHDVRPACLVYVSCNPEALAHDLGLVSTAGYAVERVQPVDMFPHTAHVEAVAILRRPFLPARAGR